MRIWLVKHRLYYFFKIAPWFEIKGLNFGFGAEHLPPYFPFLHCHTIIIQSLPIPLCPKAIYIPYSHVFIHKPYHFLPLSFLHIIYKS